MSGTSVDGIDAAIVEFSSANQLRVIETEFTPFDATVRARINNLAQQNSAVRHRSDTPLHTELASSYASASQAVLAKAGLHSSEISGIANHGQTVRHEPNAQPPFSIQLGDPQLIADLTGIITYAQFRQADLAAGGQGAPLMPAFHQAVFGAQSGVAILNIGGIANITQLGDTTLGFDTGPGNTLLDQWINATKGERYDRDGVWSRQGSTNQALLARCLADPYFSAPAPKSTGPDYFNLGWLGDVSKLPPADVQATLLELTVVTIANAVSTLSAPIERIYVCGGGAQNSALMTDLSRALPKQKLLNTDQLGVPSDWVEAVGFAWLGYCCKHKINSNLPSVTGATKACVLGERYEPNAHN